MARKVNVSSDLITRADGFAACAHRKQLRKYTGSPYIEHPRRVAELLRGYVPDFVRAAALLHDTIEDCGVTYNEIDAEFGANVATLVYQVTDVFTKESFPAWNRLERKNNERHRLGKSAAYAQSIKVADLMDNTSDIVANDKDFAKVYLREKAALLEVLIEAHPVLLLHANAQVEQLSNVLKP